MSHEASITVEVDGKWFNIPSVFEGQVVSRKIATDLFIEGKIQPLPSVDGILSFDTEEDANTSAKIRSDAIDPETLEFRKNRGLMRERSIGR